MCFVSVGWNEIKNNEPNYFKEMLLELPFEVWSMATDSWPTPGPPEPVPEPEQLLSLFRFFFLAPYL